MRINQNIMAFNAYRNLSNTQNQMGNSLEKLSSGFRINRAADDAAGLSISEQLRSDVRGLTQATRNAQDGISVAQTAEGALTEVHSMLQRMRELAVQASNTGSTDTGAREAIQAEIDELASEIDRISETTSFAGVNLLDGGFGKEAGTLTAYVTGDTALTDANTFTMEFGGDTATVTVDDTTRDASELGTYLEEQIRSALLAEGGDLAGMASQVSVNVTAVDGGHTVTIENLSDNALAFAEGTGTPLEDIGFTPGTLDAAVGDAGVFQVGANNGDTIEVSIAEMSAASLTVDALDVVNEAGDAIDLLSAAVTQVSEQRSELGATQNRFEHTISNLQVTTENLQASESRIRDTDMAAEMVDFTRHQILQQAGTAMLAQANQVPQSVLGLL